MHFKFRFSDGFKPRIRESNPLLDIRYWMLLNDIISRTDHQTARTIKKWLLPLLTRMPIAPLVISLLDLLSTLEQDRRQQLTSTVCRCFVVIWPLSAPKFSPDSLTECFGAFLRLLDVSAADESLAQIGCLITSSYKSYQANASNSRKASCILMSDYRFIQSNVSTAAVHVSR